MVNTKEGFKLGRYWLDQIHTDGVNRSTDVTDLSHRQLQSLVVQQTQNDLRRVIDYTQHLKAWYRRTDLNTLCSQVIRDTAALMLTDVDYERYFNAQICSCTDALHECYVNVQFDKRTLQDSWSSHNTDKFAHHLGSEKLRWFLYQDQKPISVLDRIPTPYVMRQVNTASSRVHNLSQIDYQAVDGDMLVYYCERLLIALNPHR